LLHYPLYGGLVGLLGYQAAQGSKPLQTLLAEAVVSGATQHTLPFLTFVGSVKPVRILRWRALGRPGAGRSRLGAGHRSALARLPRVDLHGRRRRRGGGEHDPPFWLLPLLAIAKLNVRQVMGFTVVAFLIGFVVLGATTLIAPHVI